MLRLMGLMTGAVLVWMLAPQLADKDLQSRFKTFIRQPSDWSLPEAQVPLAVADKQPAPPPAPAAAPLPTQSGDTLTATPKDGPPPAATPTRWFPIWPAFNSPAAADGFSAHIAAQTALQLRTERLVSGRYQVMLAYSDDASLAVSLADIEALTGLTTAGRAP